MTKLSVNINKIATLRNARGGAIPDVCRVARDIEAFGADGITVHPRPDGRHIRYDDVRTIKKNISVELNVEGYPSEDFLQLVFEVRPHQVTLVPDPPDALTSNAGWDTLKHRDFLSQVIHRLKDAGMRTSIFVEPDPSTVSAARATGTHRVELYTEYYDNQYASDRSAAIQSYIASAHAAIKAGLGINAGHDLNLDNLSYFHQNIPGLLEVSIGHALICDALYFGLENTVNLYKRQLH